MATKKNESGCFRFIAYPLAIMFFLGFIKSIFSPSPHKEIVKPETKPTQTAISTPIPTPTIELSEAKKKRIWFELLDAWEGISISDQQQIENAAKEIQKRYNITDAQLREVKMTGMQNDWQLRPTTPTPKPGTAKKVIRYTTVNEPTPIPIKYSCTVTKSCSEITTCAEARFQLNQCFNRNLDRDGDGIPCESLCR